MIEKLTHERPDTIGDLHKKYIETNQSDYPLNAVSSPEEGVFLCTFLTPPKAQRARMVKQLTHNNPDTSRDLHKNGIKNTSSRRPSKHGF